MSLIGAFLFRAQMTATGQLAVYGTLGGGVMYAIAKAPWCILLLLLLLLCVYLFVFCSVRVFASI
jgi:hypothetical protein